ncbi:glucosidase II Gtb1 [Schizosaccharomyces japonicus yFS275]|uniref:Glucosidase 2 subunit beta n=1 Tax=Schizosaccharomyces japonicus (strain yFS275 / FY16936) TaxID=402676 RepID=B6K4H4_SCHJY|nr:glucosidase II Gtb1 [Schizosaccharomyces japonicus yFS275]EEB08381.1 glucosidase II Gtb1 [Schizosaccharomyces japonicus yFS275]
MHFTTRTLFFLPWLLQVAVSDAKTEVLGVSPKELNLYQPDENGNWKCLNSSKVISFSQVNDDYCDCPDGSDEPGTSACQNGRFFCVNKGYISTYIPSNRVNDGLCDCCDGSDEYMEIVHCENTCNEKAAVYLDELNEHNNQVRKGIDIRNEWVRAAEVKNEELKKIYDENNSKMLATMKRKNELQAQLDRMMRENVDITQLLNDDLSSMKETVDLLLLERSEFIKRMKILEDILKDMASGYNPNYQDMAVKDAASRWKEVENDKLDLLVEEGPTAELVDAVEEHLAMVPVLKAKEVKKQKEASNGLIDQTKQLLFSAAESVPFLNNLVSGKKETEGHDSEVSSKALERLEHQLNEVKYQYDDLQSEQARLFEDMNEPHGWDDIYRVLKGMETKAKSGDYEYRIRFYETVFQDDISLGEFVEQEGNILKYANGQKCWNGPPRSAQVKVECGKSNEIISVLEAQKCEYLIQMLSPAACSTTLYRKSLITEANEHPTPETIAENDEL